MNSKLTSAFLMTMSDDGAAENGGSTEAQSKEETQTEEITEVNEEKPEEKSEDKDSELPEWAQKERTDLRAEAANYRTQLRAAQKALSEAKSQEDIDAAVAALNTNVATLEREILVRDVAESANLPLEMRQFLQGNTKEELEQSAQVLAKYAPAKKNPESDLSGGLTPSGSAKSTSESMEQIAEKYSRFRQH